MIDELKAIAELKSGNTQAFAELYDTHVKPIYNFIYFRTHHKPTAEDLTSIVFTKAFERIGQFDSSKAKFSTWLYQIAKNSLIDHYRTFKQTDDIADIWDFASTANVEKDADTALALEKVQAHIKQLPVLQRDILVMRLWDGLSHKEIAEVLGITEGNSKVNFSRGLEKLKTSIGGAGILLLIIYLRL